MIIRLGNMSLEEIVTPEYLPKIQAFLDENGYHREQVCNDIGKKDGNYHIFDMPRLFVIKGKEKMEAFIKFLQENHLVELGFKERIGWTYE